MSDLKEGGWVALLDPDKFDPIFDLDTQWGSRQAAVSLGAEHLRLYGPGTGLETTVNTTEPVTTFYVAQVLTSDPIVSSLTSRSVQIVLQHLEKVVK